MMREVLKLTNLIKEDIQLTVDIPSDHQDKKLPVLVLNIWVEDRFGDRGEQYQEIVHEFYEEEMVAPRVIGKESGLPERVKKTTLTQEIIRILKNTSKKKKKAAMMSRFTMKLKLSRYDKRERKDILAAGLKGFNRLEELDKEGKRNLNRSRNENRAARLLKIHEAKRSCYKGRGLEEEWREG